MEFIQEYVAKIVGLKEELESVTTIFRSNLDEKERNFNVYSADDWKINTFGNALVRLRLIIENNLIVIETNSLLATCRYVCELGIWLHLFKKDKRYCLVYYREYLLAQRRHHRDTLARFDREIVILDEHDAAEKKLQNNVASMVKDGKLGAADHATLLRSAGNIVDDKADLSFSIYLDQAKINGYSFQAYLVRTKAIPEAEASLREVERLLAEFDKHVGKEIQRLANGQWSWRKMANVVGLVDEHDYIYSYASRLLHATPMSITTDQKNLEPVEINIFLRYLYVKVKEIIELARSEGQSMPNQAL